MRRQEGGECQPAQYEGGVTGLSAERALQEWGWGCGWGVGPGVLVESETEADGKEDREMGRATGLLTG